LLFIHDLFLINLILYNITHCADYFDIPFHLFVSWEKSLNQPKNFIVHKILPFDLLFC